MLFMMLLIAAEEFPDIERRVCAFSPKVRFYTTEDIDRTMELTLRDLESDQNMT